MPTSAVVSVSKLLLCSCWLMGWLVGWLVSGDRVSLCSPFAREEILWCPLLFARSPKLHTIALPLRLPSFLPSSSLLFSSLFAHTHTQTSAHWPSSPPHLSQWLRLPSFARHRVRFRLLFLSCFVFPAFCLSPGQHALSVVSFVSEVLKVCACFCFFSPTYSF